MKIEPVTKFDKGCIVRVKLHNFLTYTDVEFRPGPRLNVIMGPNGTGKSSVVCAIAIGLGASPKVLGRGDTLSEFVRTGCEEAMTEIDLMGEAGAVTTIRRDIHKSSRGQSKWKINDRSATEPDVRKLVETEFNIQIANLCTFLPQEKVGEFSAFDDIGLLRETERAVGGRALVEQHDSLIAAQREVNERQRREEGLREKLDDLQEQKKALMPEMDRLERRQEHLDAAELCRKRIIWLDFELKKDEAAAARDEEREKRGEYDRALKVIEPLQEKARLAKDAVDRTQEIFVERSTKTAELARVARKFAEDIEKYTASIENAKASFENVKTRNKKTEDKLTLAEKQLAEQTKELEQFVNSVWPHRRDDKPPNVENILEEKRQEMKRLKPAVNAAQGVYDEDCEHVNKIKDKMKLAQRSLTMSGKELSNLDDVATQRLRNFSRINQVAHEAAKLKTWIDENAGIFVKPILGPVGLEVTGASSKLHKTIVEAHVGHWLWTSFVCQTKKDYDTLHHSREKLNYMLPGVHVVAEVKPIERPVTDIVMNDVLKSCGIEGYVDELIQGTPPQIIDMLNSQARVCSAMYGSAKEIEANIPAIEHQFSRSFVYYAYKRSSRNEADVELLRYSGVKSRYANVFSTSVNRSDGKGYLSDAVDPADRDRADQRFRQAEKVYKQHADACAEANLRLEKSKKVLDAAKSDLSAIQEWMSKVKGAISQVSNAEKKVRQLKADIVRNKRSDEADRARAKGEMEKNLKLLTTRMAEQAANQKAIIKATIRSAAPLIAKDRQNFRRNVRDSSNHLQVLKARKAESDAVLKEKQKDTERLRSALDNAKKEFARIKKEALDMKRRAQEQAPRDSDLEKKFEELPADRDAILQKQQFEESEASQIHENKGLQARYEKLVTEVDQHEKRLDAIVSDQRKRVAEITTLREPWERTLRGALTALQSKFEEYMATLEGARGTVEISQAETYDRWGLTIKVAFRDGASLCKLQAHVQSGGERSVSTIMFLMALQAHMPSPFRVVDEINQGMDEVNERIVFRRVVINSTGPNAPQYFLITPKLLPKLKDMDHPDVRALVVFNGTFNLKRPQDWDISAFIANKKRSVVAAAA